MTRWRSRLLGMAALAWLGWAVYRLVALLPGRALNFDFNHYYTSSWLVRQGASPYRADLIAVSRQLGFVPTDSIPHATNPPVLLWLLAPVTWLSPVPAFWVWTGILALAWGGLLWLTLDLLGDRLSRRGRWLCVAYFAGAMSVFSNFYFAHVELVLAVLVLAGYRCLARGRGAWAVMLVTVAGLLKLFPFALLPWFVWRSDARWQNAGLAAGLIVAGVVASGLSLWRDFFAAGLDVVANLAVGYLFNFSFAAFAGKLFLTMRNWLDAGWPLAWAQTVTSLTGVAVLAAGYGFCWFKRRELEAEFGVLSVALLMGSLTAWGFYFVFLLFPVVALATRLRTRRQWLWWVAGVLMLEIMLTQPGGIWMNHWPTFGAIVLGVLWWTAEAEA